MVMRDVTKYIRSAKVFDEAKEKYKIMADNTHRKTYPPGTRPFVYDLWGVG